MLFCTMLAALAPCQMTIHEKTVHLWFEFCALFVPALRSQHGVAHTGTCRAPPAAQGTLRSEFDFSITRPLLRLKHLQCIWSPSYTAARQGARISASRCTTAVLQQGQPGVSNATPARTCWTRSQLRLSHAAICLSSRALTRTQTARACPPPRAPAPPPLPSGGCQGF